MVPWAGMIPAVPAAVGLIVIKIGRILFLGFLVLSLASCSANSSRVPGSDPEIFHVGELEVRLYSNRELMVRSLPPIFAALAATRVGKHQIQVSGYYDKENKRIYAIDDARTVIHELKHYLEPDWRHGSDEIRQGKVQQGPAEPKSSFVQVTPANSTGRE